MPVPSLKKIVSKRINTLTRVSLTCRLQELVDLKLSFVSLASEQLALSVIGKLIDDFDQLRVMLKQKMEDCNRINTLHLRVRHRLNAVYDQISYGMYGCTSYPPHRDGDCGCHDALYNESFEYVNFIRERLF